MAEQHGDVQHLALEVREGVVRVHDLRRQHRRDHGVEILFDIFPLTAVELVHGGAAQILLREAGVNIAERCVAPRVQRLYRRIDAAELFSGGETGLGVAAVRLERRHIGQAADTDHEKFIQIAGENRKKFESFEQRNGLILRLGQYARIKFKPGQLSVLCISLIPDRVCHGRIPLSEGRRAA